MRLLLLFLFVVPLFAQVDEDAQNDVELEELINRETIQSNELVKKAQAIADGKGNPTELLKVVASQAGAISKEDEKKTNLSPLEIINSVDIYKLTKHALAPFRGQSSAQVRSNLVERLNQTPAKIIPEKAPRFVDYIVVLLRDSEAIPKASTLLKEREKLKQYAIFFVVTIIISWFWNRYKGNAKSFWKGVARFFRRFIFWNLLRLAVFYYLFKVELTPLIEITIKFIKG